MPRITKEDILRAQNRGWMVEAVDEDRIVGRCPAHGCGLKAVLKAGSKIPQCDPDLRRDPTMLPIGIYDDLRLILKERREGLNLSMGDIEFASGLADGHVNKMESPNPARIPQIDTVLLWLQSLGYELVVRPTELPPATASILEGTRDMSGIRARRNWRRARNRR